MSRDTSWSLDLPDRFPDSRRRFELALDGIVREHRVTIAVVFPAIGALSLVASAEGWLPTPLQFNPWILLIGVLVMRSPLVVGVLPLLDRRAGAWIGILVGYTYAIESVGIRTGWPYGTFEYGIDLGPMVGGIPIALPVFFIPLVMNGYLLRELVFGSRVAGTIARFSVVTAIVVGMDVVLDPGAVALGFWVYDAGSAFYDVPISNYLGWVLSAAVAVATLDRAFDRERLIERLRSCPFMLDDVVSFVLLWGGINLWFGNMVPAVVAVGFGIGLFRSDRFDARAFDPRGATDREPGMDRS